MAETSNTIVNKMKFLVTKLTKEQGILIAYGFIRAMALDGVPVEIINYCIVYAFLRENRWFKGGNTWNIDQTGYIATASSPKNLNIDSSTIYADPAISKGKHEWKIQISEEGKLKGNTVSNALNFGIATSMHCLNSHFLVYMMAQQIMERKIMHFVILELK